MKKLIAVLVFFLFISTLIACQDSTPETSLDDSIDFLDIYYVNDLHGAILPNQDSIGMAHIANFILYQKNQNPDETIILAGGDMLHGSALSNANYGALVIEMMNAMGFDAFVIGNHEFDWGLEKVTRYFNNSDDHIANFPLLGANVFYKGTENIPDGIDPYVIIERNSLRIGIIGTIEYGIENTIATQHVEDYYFADPGPIVTDLTTYLRTEENVDIVILISHDRGTVNQQIIYNEGDSKVDAIFNGHSHQVYARYERGIPAIQSGGYGSHVGHLRMNLVNHQIQSYSMDNLDRSNEPRFGFADLEFEMMIEAYYSELDELYHVELLNPARDYSRDELTEWLSKLLAVSSDADIGFHNGGGTRRNLYKNASFDFFTVFDIWPFDNEIVTFYLSGSDIKDFINTFNWRNYHTDIENFDDETLYKVATHDFIYYRDNYAILRTGSDLTKTGVFLRDLAFDELLLQTDIYPEFRLDNTLLTTPNYYQEEEDTIQP